MTESLKAVVLPDRKIVAISGTDRVKFLQGLMTNDIRRLTPDRALYAGFLTGQGKLLCDAFVMQDGDRILIDIAGAHVEDFVKRLIAFKLRAAVEIGETVPALAVAAVWGTGATARLELDSAEGVVGDGALAEAQYAFVDPRIAALGARLVYSADFPIEAKLARLGFASVTPADYAMHRLALGIADTAEIGGEVCYPLEANFEMLHGVDFKKGCYIGQELTARMKLKGELRKQILPVSGPAPLPTAGTPVTADGTALGPLIAASGTGPCLAPPRSSGRRKRRCHPCPGRAAHCPLAELATALKVAAHASDDGPGLPGATLSQRKTRLTGADNPDQ